MRTTITLDPDVAAALTRLRGERGGSVSEVVNDLVREALAAQHERRPRFVQKTSSMGSPLVPLDCIADGLDLIEGPAHR